MTLRAPRGSKDLASKFCDHLRQQREARLHLNINVD